MSGYETETLYVEDGVIEIDLYLSYTRATRRSPAESSVEIEEAKWVEHYPSDGKRDGEDITDEEFVLVEENSKYM